MECAASDAALIHHRNILTIQKHEHVDLGKAAWGSALQYSAISEGDPLSTRF